jgi:hypothetical protein
LVTDIDRSRHIGLFPVCRFLRFFFVIPDILETYWGEQVPTWNYFLEVTIRYSFQTVWWEFSHIQAAVFGLRNYRAGHFLCCLLRLLSL